MVISFLLRPRSRKRFLIISVTALVLWLYIQPHLTTSISPVNYLTRPSVYSQMLDHVKKPLCPKFRKYDRQKLLLLEPNDCTPLASKHPDFSADICFSPYTCNEGLVRVRRRDRTACMAANRMYPISGNATHDAFHRQFSGPDSFHVVFSGSEKLSPPDWYHAGQCLYVFPFHISNPGKLSLDITHLYDNFGAIVEQADEWPVLRNQKVVSNLPLEVCRGCPARVAPPRFPVHHEGSPGIERREREHGFNAGSTSNNRNRYDSYSLLENNGVLTPDPDLPLCSREVASQGAWLPAHPLDKQGWRWSNYTWTPLGCRYNMPLDASCLQRKKSKKILFQGDTHLREVMANLLSRLNGTNTLQTTVAPSVERIEEKIGQTTLVYLHDPLFAHAGEKSDMIVANLGHWATGTKFLDQQWSTSKYHDKLRDLVEMIQQRARDLQDLQDEDKDFDSTHRFVDGEYVNGYDDEEEEEEESHSEDDDEYEYEQAREKMRQQRQQSAANENEDLEINWSDETEEDKVESRPSRPSRPSEDDHEEYRDYEGRYRDGRYREEDSYGARRNRYGNNDSNNDHRTPERPHLRLPGSHIFRQSKHLKGHVIDGKDEDSARSSSSSSSDRMGPFREGQDHTEKSIHGRYSYGVQTKVVESEDNNLANNRDELLNEASDGNDDNKKDSAVHRHWTNSGKEEARPYRSSGENIPSVTRGNSREGVRKGGSRDNKEAGSKTSDDRNRAGRYTNINQGSHASQGSRDYEKTDYRMVKRSTHQRRDGKVGAVSKSRPELREAFKEETLQMAWAGMVAYPESQPVNDRFFSHDWRTIYRLRYWNQIAEDVMLLHGVRFMDFFSMTLSMLDTSPDRSHYFGTDAAEAMLEELQFKLGLCEEDEKGND
ncbi:hypothetical protein BGZ52_002587 [Haplosporangium bisporale]|nr:hypothetical protein BGZ52_002587 [Haplosporangium bisporale]